MHIDDDDRAFLISNMSDESVAALLAQSLGWVQKRRAYLAEIATPRDNEERAAIGALADTLGQAEAERLLQPPADDSFDGLVRLIPAEPMSIFAPSNEEAKSDEAVVLVGRSLSELASPLPPLPPLAPPGLTGEALAEWLYDNTQRTYAEIAALTGVPEARVEAIANGEPPTPEKAPLAAAEPARVVAPQKPANRRPAPAQAPARSARAEIPARVLRWAGWFLAARWRMADVAHLFDVEAGDLAAALERRQRAA